MKALRIQNIYFTAPDVEDIKLFYQGLFAPQLKFEDKDKWVQYDLLGSNVALASHQEAGDNKNAIVVFEIDDAGDLRRQVAELGGAVADVRDMGSHGTIYTVTDPVGNMFQLFTRPGTEAP